MLKNLYKKFYATSVQLIRHTTHWRFYQITAATLEHPFVIANQQNELKPYPPVI